MRYHAKTYASTGDLHGAREAWDESLQILGTLHHPSAVMVRGRLAALTSGRLPGNTGVLGVPVPDDPADAGAA